MKNKGNKAVPPGAAGRAGERKLHRGGEVFRQMVESIQEVFWVTDAAKTRMLYISPGYEHIWGRPCQELYDSPRAWVEAVHPGDRARVLQSALTRQITGGYDEEYRVVRPDGRVRWVHDRAFPVKGGGGKVTRIVGMAEDITERKGTEELLRRTGTELRAVFENAALRMALTGAKVSSGRRQRALQELLDAIGAAIGQERFAPAERPELGVVRRQYEQLTPREREVMALITAGRMNKQVARELATAVRTVKFHRANIMQKMRAKSLAELVRMAEKLGICSPS